MTTLTNQPFIIQQLVALKQMLAQHKLILQLNPGMRLNRHSEPLETMLQEAQQFCFGKGVQVKDTSLKV